MSNTLTKVLELNISAYCKLVLIYLLYCENRFDPTIEMIGRNTSLSFDTVSRSLKILENMGIISIQRQHARINIYTVNLE